MQFSPFYMGNDTIPFDSTGYVRSNNFGVQLNFSVPLDGGMIETCKGIARKHEQKMRLDYELVRALKCTEIMKSGFTFRPGSRVEMLCHDIVPICQSGKFTWYVSIPASPLILMLRISAPAFTALA